VLPRSHLLLRFLATWLLAGVLLSVVLGPAVGIPVGLIIALGYIDAIHWKLVRWPARRGERAKPQQHARNGAL
jgi:hypothetical protein